MLILEYTEYNMRLNS